MTRLKEAETISILSRAARPLTGAPGDFDPLLERIGDRRFVLLGEATHGTAEFYRARSEVTRRLIEEQGFDCVAIEADFPDAARVNRFVNLAGADGDADHALSDFRRFPRWMWRNREVLEFVRWLRGHNERAANDDERAGFYGIDLYSLHASIDAVLAYLEKVDPRAAERARRRYECFERFEDSQEYGYAAGRAGIESCEDGAVEQMIELQRRAQELASADGRSAAEEFFAAEQNARLVRNAEEYYRSMFRGRVSSWNLRDRHMTDTLEALVRFGEWRGRASKIVVWAHNSHLGDARATEMGDAGEWNVGQLARERFGRENCLLVGFSTYEGAVTAASNWGDEAEYKRVRPGTKGSYEELFHRVANETGAPDFLLAWRGGDETAEALARPRLERAIGVIYRPETERQSHYFRARLSEQFDALVHFDRTSAVRPLDPPAAWNAAHATHAGETPDTYPTGI